MPAGIRSDPSSYRIINLKLGILLQQSNRPNYVGRGEACSDLLRNAIVKVNDVNKHTRSN